jgi:hypothetical protein
MFPLVKRDNIDGISVTFKFDKEKYSEGVNAQLMDKFETNLESLYSLKEEENYLDSNVIY